MKKISTLFNVSGCILGILVTATGLLALEGYAGNSEKNEQKTEISALTKSRTSQALATKPLVAKNSTSFPVNKILPQIKGKTRVPIFLPSSLPFSNKVYYKSTATANAYRVEFNQTANCNATACYIGAFEAEKGGKFTTKMGGERETLKNIQLSDGTKGIFYNYCGAYCTALVEWQYQGVLYRVTIKNGLEEELMKIANSAIKAGVR